MISLSSTGNPAPGRTGAGYAWFVVLVLDLLQVGSNIDRQVINLMVDNIRRDFAVSDTQTSLLLGFAFATFHAFVGLPIGRLADRYSRVRIIVVGVLFWSIATLLCMLTAGYWGLFAARVLVGVGEAALVPAGFSLLGDYFKPGQIARATSALIAASFMGTGIALSFGGFVLSRLPAQPNVVLPIVGSVHTWQLAFGFASIPSLAVLMLFPLVREPPRHGAVTAAAVPIAEIVAFVTRSGRLWMTILGGMFLIDAFQYGLSAWIPTFFVRTYGWTPARIGSFYGACFMVFGTVGTFSGGWVCDALTVRYGRIAFLATPLFSAACAAPLVILVALAGNPMISAWALIPLTYLGTFAFGSGIAAVPALAPNRMRAQLVAAYTVGNALLGQGLGPWFIALFTDYVVRDTSLIRYSLATVGPILLTCAAVVLVLGIKSVRSDNVRSG